MVELVVAQSKKSSDAESAVSDKKLRGLWKNLTAAKLVEVLRIKDPQGRWSASGSRVVGRCPFHDDNNPSFTIQLDRGFGKCFACDTFVGNPVTFWAKVTGLSSSAAFGDLKQYFTLDSISDASGAKMAAWERNQLIKQSIMRVSHAEMIRAVSDPTNPDYAMLQPAVTYLLKDRKIPAAALPSLPMLGILPPLLRIVNLLAAEATLSNTIETARAAEANERPTLQTGLQTEVAEYLKDTHGWTGALMFRLDRSPASISRLKLRRPHTKEIVMLADDYEKGSGTFGLSWPMYRPFLGARQDFCAPVCVEGEFDALAIMAQQVLAGSPGVMMLSVGGSAGADNLAGLHELGFDTVHLLGDSPAKKGDDLIKQWLPGIDKLHARIFCGYHAWPGAGDPDDAVNAVGLAGVESALLSVEDSNFFKTPPRWLVEDVRDSIEATPPDQSRRRIELASATGKLLRNKNDAEDFIQCCAQQFGIAVGALKREMAAQTDTQEGYVYRVSEELERIFFVVGVRREGSTQMLHLWHREEKQALAVAVNDVNDALQTIMVYIHAIWKFFEERVGVPAWLDLAANNSKQGLLLDRKIQNYKSILREALNVLTFNATNLANAKRMGAGIHRIDKGSDCELYFVNGTDVYHGYYVGEQLKWRELAGPADGGYVFDMDSPKWAKHIHRVEDLERATSIDIAACADKLEKALLAGWRFKNHEVTAKYLAHHLMATTIAGVFDRRVIISFNGDTHAGKSRLLLGLIAGVQDEAIHLIEATYGFKMNSAAGFKQEMHEKALAPCLDEFESDGSKASAVVDNIMSTIFRGILTGNNTQKMGSRSGKATGYSLNFFVFVAAIHRAPNAQDANRMVQISLDKIEGRTSPVTVLLDLFGAEELATLKEDLTIALLPHAKKLRDTFRELDRALTPEALAGVKIEDRLKGGLLPAMSVMHLLGKDAKAFLLDYCSANADQLVSTGTRSDSMDIFDYVTQTAGIPVDGTQGRTLTSFLAMLPTPESRAAVNYSGTGLYYDDDAHLLVVNWTMATQSVLRNHPRFGRAASAQNLRELANRVTFALTTEQLDASGALLRLRKFGLYGIEAHKLTGYRLDHLLAPQVSGSADKTATIIQLPAKKTDDGSFG